MSLFNALLRPLLKTAAITIIAIAPALAQQQVLKVTTIPEEAATEQMRKFGPITKYLERVLGMKVEFTPVNDYPAAVEALVNKQVDVVWFGGFTHVRRNCVPAARSSPSRSAKKTPSFVPCLSPKPIPASRRWPTSKASR
jgi:phosphonate transport system substrate-binding protein